MKNTGAESIRAIKEVLDLTPGPLVVIPHSNPDGDAIGSAYGLAIVLRNAGKQVKVVTPNDYPVFLHWLQGEVEIINYLKNKSLAEDTIKSSSLMFCIDFNEIGRADELQKLISQFTGTRILIDHHPDPTPFCDWVVSEPTYSSSAELVYDLLKDLGLVGYLDKSSAEALFTGIMTDTGSFSYSTSRPGMYHVLAALTAFPIDTDRIHSLVYDCFSADRFRLVGYCLLHKMVVLPEFRTAYIAVTREELKRFGFVPGDTEGLVNMPLSIAGIVFSAFFLEKDNLVKVSFRSKGRFPVNAFSSAHFSGGGHLNAAGGEAKGSLESIVEKFRQLLPSCQELLDDAGTLL